MTSNFTNTSITNATCVYSSGDTAWVLTSTILVLAMKPGLALFEIGLLRSKNSVSVMAQVIVGMMVLGLLWYCIGFSLVFGDSLGGFIGNPATYGLFLGQGFGYDECLPMAPTIPGLIFALFELMFSAITPLLITGGFADRLKFRSFILFMTAWELIVYYPLAHWIWGNGWLSTSGYIFPKGEGVIDFAGGITIHTSAGVASLTSALVLGQRIGFEKKHGLFRPSNLVTAAIGASLLWMGWFGFNAGSSNTAGSVAALAMVTTHICAMTSGVVWVGLFYLHNRRPSLIASLGGGIAGLAGITPASGFIQSQWALLIGFLIGVATFYSSLLTKAIGIDDALDVISIHGVSGMIGSISIGFFATKAVNPQGQDGAVAGHPIQICYQLLGVVVAAVWSAFWTFIILQCMRLCCQIRVSERVERMGLDIAEHGELIDDYAYHRNKMYLKLHPDFKAKVDAFLQKDDEHSESTSHDLSDSVELEELKLSEEKQRSRLNIYKNEKNGRVKNGRGKKRKKDKAKKRGQEDLESGEGDSARVNSSEVTINMSDLPKI